MAIQAYNESAMPCAWIPAKFTGSCSHNLRRFRLGWLDLYALRHPAQPAPSSL
jgi:hypothetical protein